MENWEIQCDRWLTNPPEEHQSHLLCDRCKDFFLPDDKIYYLEGEKFCEECAKEWLEQQAVTATEGDCYGE